MPSLTPAIDIVNFAAEEFRIAAKAQRSSERERGGGFEAILPHLSTSIFTPPTMQPKVRKGPTQSVE